MEMRDRLMMNIAQIRAACDGESWDEADALLHEHDQLVRSAIETEPVDFLMQVADAQKALLSEMGSRRDVYILRAAEQGATVRAVKAYHHL